MKNVRTTQIRNVTSRRTYGQINKKLCQTTVYVGEESKHLIPAELSVGQTREVLQKLCEYEETGLSPDEVVKLKNPPTSKDVSGSST